MPREFHFPAAVTWEGGRRTSARVEGKHPIGIAPPPEFDTEVEVAVATPA